MKTVLGIVTVLAIALLICQVPSVAESEISDYVIVANKDVQGTTINTAALKGIYLREVRNWSGGGEIVPVDLSTGASFYQNLFGKSYVQMQAYWLNMRIKFSVNPPITKKDPESAKKYIAENKGAIGFIKNGDLDESVKVLKLTN
jgi:ABC-type phosphate transport system substrate-binding protein